MELRVLQLVIEHCKRVCSIIEDTGKCDTCLTHVLAMERNLYGDLVQRQVQRGLAGSLHPTQRGEYSARVGSIALEGCGANLDTNAAGADVHREAGADRDIGDRYLQWLTVDQHRPLRVPVGEQELCEHLLQLEGAVLHPVDQGMLVAAICPEADRSKDRTLLLNGVE